MRNLDADAAVSVELDGAQRPGWAQVVDSGDRADRARTLVFAKYQPRYGGDLTRWRDTALPVAIDLAAREAPGG